MSKPINTLNELYSDLLEGLISGQNCFHDGLGDTYVHWRRWLIQGFLSLAFVSLNFCFFTQRNFYQNYLHSIFTGALFTFLSSFFHEHFLHSICLFFFNFQHFYILLYPNIVYSLYFFWVFFIFFYILLLLFTCYLFSVLFTFIIFSLFFQHCLHFSFFFTGKLFTFLFIFVIIYSLYVLFCFFFRARNCLHSFFFYWSIVYILFIFAIFYTLSCTFYGGHCLHSLFPTGALFILVLFTPFLLLLLRNCLHFSLFFIGALFTF